MLNEDQNNLYKVLNNYIPSGVLKKKKTGKKYIDSEKTAKMIGYGLANGVFTSLTTNPILQRGIKTYKNAGFGKEFLLNSKDYITQNWKRAVVGDNVLELSGELATNVVENAIDGRPIFENADHVALSSLCFSFAFSTIPFIKGAAARYYSTSDTQLAMDRRTKQIVNLQQNWAMLDAKDPARKDIEKTILELQAVNEATIDKLEKNISTKIDRQGSAGFQGVMNFINGARQKASDIVNNPKLTPETKAEMLAKLESDFENHINARKNFLDYSTVGENVYLLEANDSNTYDRLFNEAKKRLDNIIYEIKYNATEDQLLLAWLLKHPSGIVPVVGTTNKKRLQQAIADTKIELELDENGNRTGVVVEGEIFNLSSLTQDPFASELKNRIQNTTEDFIFTYRGGEPREMINYLIEIGMPVAIPNKEKSKFKFKIGRAHV